jgi:hypothetical protein
MEAVDARIQALGAEATRPGDPDARIRAAAAAAGALRRPDGDAKIRTAGLAAIAAARRGPSAEEARERLRAAAHADAAVPMLKASAPSLLDLGGKDTLLVELRRPPGPRTMCAPSLARPAPARMAPRRPGPLWRHLRPRDRHLHRLHHGRSDRGRWPFTTCGTASPGTFAPAA